MPYDEYTHDPYTGIILEPPIDRYTRIPTTDKPYSALPISEPIPRTRPSNGTGRDIFGGTTFAVGKYQYTTEEYFTGERVEADGSVSVVIPERKKAVEETTKAIEDTKQAIADIGDTGEKIFTGAVIILVLVIIAGIVT